MVTPLAGASVWESELYGHLTGHEESERALLAEYARIAEHSSSAAFRYLVGLIVEDETRHHELLRQLAESLRADVELRRDDPAVPRLANWGAADDVIEATDRLLAEERADRKRLRQLARELKDVYDTTLWGLLVELMEMDTAKHIAILRFARRHAGGNGG